METFFLYLGCLLVGLALDWAIHGRALLYVSSIWHVESRKNYANGIFPRIIFTMIGITAIVYDAFNYTPLREWLWVGVALFLASIIYGIVISYWPKSNRL